MLVNHLTLSGTLCKAPIRKISPSGIPHFQFILEHHSLQQEAGFSRQAWCRLPVVVSGKKTLEITSSLKIDMPITVQGFITCHQGRSGLSKIVLHADQIELIDFGD